MMILLPLLLSQAVPAAQASALQDSPDEYGQAITVEGRSLEATRDALAQCLARKCPPAQDIAAAMAYADNQVIANDLHGARDTLRHARGRNKRYADRLPGPVAALLHFDAEVASLLGLADYSRIGTIDSLDALKAGLPADDPKISAQRLLVGDVFLRQGRYETAVRMYDAVARRAAESGWPALQGAAMFRALMFYATAASVAGRFEPEARHRYAALRETTDPAMRAARDASMVLEARLDLLAHKDVDIDAVMRRIGGTRTTSPMLVMTPPVELGLDDPSNPFMPPPVTAASRPNDWVDFTFRVTREGQVADLEVTSTSPHFPTLYVDRIRTAVAGRRYMPLDLPEGSPGLWRRERLMLVSDLKPQRGSRIRVQSGPPKLRSIDLSSQLEATLGQPAAPSR